MSAETKVDEGIGTDCAKLAQQTLEALQNYVGDQFDLSDFDGVVFGDASCSHYRSEFPCWASASASILLEQPDNIFWTYEGSSCVLNEINNWEIIAGLAGLKTLLSYLFPATKNINELNPVNFSALIITDNKQAFEFWGRQSSLAPNSAKKLANKDAEFLAKNIISVKSFLVPRVNQFLLHKLCDERSTAYRESLEAFQASLI